MNTFNVFNIFLNIAYNRIYRRAGAFAVNTALRQRFFGVIKEKPRGVNYNLLTIALGYFITAQPAAVKLIHQPYKGVVNGAVRFKNFKG